MSPEKILYTAHATSTGGRAGTSKSPDGALNVTLTTPKELGGDGGLTRRWFLSLPPPIPQPEHRLDPEPVTVN